ncbi:hypothetical protein D5366_01275 [Neokomagataea tanensis]|uniref:Uncharacterized protein n=1 Tax=Neokomagataea tanensis TaxID=661191 RepID=A0A4Y6V6A9_9PROT|nr:hypothetical protein D5366_01275 [Neokomagataea tanensis]
MINVPPYATFGLHLVTEVQIWYNLGYHGILWDVKHKAQKNRRKLRLFFMAELWPGFLRSFRIFQLPKRICFYFVNICSYFVLINSHGRIPQGHGIRVQNEWLDSVFA